MDFSRDRQRQVRIAAERSGYRRSETEALIQEPQKELQKGERLQLQLSNKGIEAFMRVLDGQPTDMGKLIDLGNQLYNIEDPGGRMRQKRESRQYGYSSRRQTAEDGWPVQGSISDEDGYWDGEENAEEEMRPPSFPGKPEKNEVKLSFNDEQRLLLAKNLLEDAFFRGTLVNLKGEPAAGLAFIANRLAKVLEKGYMPDIAQEFNFDERQFRRLCAEASREIKPDRDLDEAERQLDLLYGQKERIDREIQAADALRKQEILRLRMKLRSEQEQDYTDERDVYRQQLREMGDRAVATFDRFLSDKAYAAEAKRVLSRIVEGVRRKEGLERAEEKLLENAGATLALTLDQSAPVDAERRDAALALLRRAANDLKSVTRARGAEAQPLANFLWEITKGPSGAYGVALDKARQRNDMKRRLVEFERDALHEPTVQELAAERDQLAMAIRDIDGELNGYREELEAFTTSMSRCLRDMRENPAASLYFMKTYLAVVDMRQRDIAIPIPWGNYGDIATHRFSDKMQGFTNVHYAERYLPLATWLTRHQMNASGNEVAKDMPRFTLRSGEAIRKEREERLEKAKLVEFRSEIAELYHLSDWMGFVKKEKEFHQQVAQEMERLGDDMGAEKAEQEGAYAEKKLTQLYDLMRANDTLTKASEAIGGFVTYERIEKSFPELVREKMPDEAFGFQHRKISPGEVRMRARELARAGEAWEQHTVVLEQVVSLDALYERARAFADRAAKALTDAEHFGAPEGMRSYIAQSLTMAEELVVEQEVKIKRVVDANPTLFPSACFSDGLFTREAIASMHAAANMSRWTSRGGW